MMIVISCLVSVGRGYGRGYRVAALSLLSFF